MNIDDLRERDIEVDNVDKVNFFVFTKQILKNLGKKPATVAYPFEPVEFTERNRGHIEITAEECIGCGMCMRMCPPGAIKVNRAENTWSIEPFDCVQCGSCVNSCPKKCLHMVVGYTKPGAEKGVDTVTIPEKKIPPKKPAAPAAAKPAAPVNQAASADANPTASAASKPVTPAADAAEAKPQTPSADTAEKPAETAAVKTEAAVNAAAEKAEEVKETAEV